MKLHWISLSSDPMTGLLKEKEKSGHRETAMGERRPWDNRVRDLVMKLQSEE